MKKVITVTVICCLGAMLAWASGTWSGKPTQCLQGVDGCAFSLQAPKGAVQFLYDGSGQVLLPDQPPNTSWQYFPSGTVISETTNEGPCPGSTPGSCELVHVVIPLFTTELFVERYCKTPTGNTLNAEADYVVAQHFGYIHPIIPVSGSIKVSD